MNTIEKTDYRREVRIAAREYAKRKLPNNLNRFITYLHNTFKPESQRKTWIQEIELNNMEDKIHEIIERNRES